MDKESKVVTKKESKPITETKKAETKTTKIEKTPKEKKKFAPTEDEVRLGKRQSYMIALISALSLAIVLIIVEGCLGHFSSIFALTSVCFAWAGVYSICKYAKADRKAKTLTIGVIETVVAVALFVFFIISLVW